MRHSIEYRRVKVLRVEGSNRSRRHRHVTVSPNKHHDVNDSGDVTKIELELEEAPYDAISVGSVPSGLDTTGEINSTYPDGIPGPGAVVVRAEEALIVVLVLVLWVAAIALFFNRWGKIRMLEPYQPKFQQQHRQSYAVVEQNPVQNRSYSKFNVHCADHPSLHDSSYASGLGSRPRQNSVFVSPSISMLPSNHGTPRRTKSAFDLQSLVLAECQDDRDHDKLQRDQDILKSLRATNESTKFQHYDRRTSVCQSEKSDSNKPLLRERGTSICHFDRVDVSVNKPLQRDRGMSFCHFDRMDVLARPLQRDRGGSICHFDRTDVLARPLQRERGSGTSYFDRMDVLARPSPYLGRTGKERRVSVCNFVERDEENREARKDRRFSVSNFEKIEKDKVQEEEEEEEPEGQVIFTKCKPREKKSNVHQFDRPSCSKTPDVMLGYKATCV